MTATQNQNDTHRGTTVTSNEIVKASPLMSASLPQMIDYAEKLSNAGLLPSQYRKQPANVLYAMEYGRTLGITPIAAMSGIHVIEGKPTASSGLIGALVRQAGHKLRVTGNDQKAVAIIIRADDPDFEYRSEWTLDRARTAGLVGKDVWRKYPAAMLKARAITEVARDACEEVLFGLHYTPEELGAVVDQDGNPVDAPVQPLRTVQYEEVPQQAPTGEGAPQSPSRDFLAEAKRAKTASEVMELAKAARAAGAPDDYRAQMKAVYEDKLAAEQRAAEEDIPEAEVVPDSPEDEHAAAVADLKAVAAQAGLSDAETEREFQASYGLPIDQAAAHSVAEFAAILRKGLAA